MFLFSSFDETGLNSLRMLSLYPILHLSPCCSKAHPRLARLRNKHKFHESASLWQHFWVYHFSNAEVIAVSESSYRNTTLTPSVPWTSFNVKVLAKLSKSFMQQSFQRSSALKLCLTSAASPWTSEKPLLSNIRFYLKNPTFQQEYTLRICINLGGEGRGCYTMFNLKKQKFLA